MHPLIIGRLPEPNNIGGVVIFVSRLLAASKFLNSHKYEFYSTKSFNPFRLGLLICNSSFVHFNGSNPLAMFFISILCHVFDKKLILSIHAEVGISGTFLNLIEQLAIRFSHKPVVGMGSIEKALRINQNSISLSSFIEPNVDADRTVDDILSSIEGKIIYCTNANSFCFDKQNRELYGITYLINFFKDLEGSILIISDTSGDYSKEFGKSLPDNVIIIEEDIDFCYLIQQSDCFIRYTSTDGDSISVMESLFFKTSVIATNCIRRHEACILCEYGDMESLAIAVKNFNERRYVDFSTIISVHESYDRLYGEIQKDYS